MADEKRPLLSSDRSNDSDGRRIRKVGPLARLWRHDFCPFIPARYTLVLVGFLGFFILYALRVNLFIAIVAMVDDSGGNSSHRVRTCRVAITFDLAQ